MNIFSLQIEVTLRLFFLCQNDFNKYYVSHGHMQYWLYFYGINEIEQNYSKM
jgi:hypothetical protein